MYNRPKDFKKIINKGRYLNHYDSIIFLNTYYRWIFEYDNINPNLGSGKYQGIKLKVILK